MACLLLENLSLLEDFFHGHGTDDDTGFAFDDAFDDILHMASLSGNDGTLASRGDVAFGVVLGSTREKEGILLQGIWLDVGTDGENGREGKLKLLNGHGLEVEGEVHRRHGYSGNFLPWVNESLLDDAYIVNVGSCNSQKLIRFCNCIIHGSR